MKPCPKCGDPLEAINASHITGGIHGVTYERCRSCGYARAIRGVPSSPTRREKRSPGRPKQFDDLSRVSLTLDPETLATLDELSAAVPEVSSISGAVRYLAGRWKEERS